MRLNYCVKWNCSEITQVHDITEQTAGNAMHHSEAYLHLLRLRVVFRMFYLTAH